MKTRGFSFTVLPMVVAAVAVARPTPLIPPGLEVREGQWRPQTVRLEGQEPATGLQKEFPAYPLRRDNPTTPERVALGKRLFFDPLLSGDNRTSCAHCHHPDLGFADGLPRAQGNGATGVGAQRRGGQELARHTPSLWNALYHVRQYWDGRAKDLEEQAQFPITTPAEMNQNRDALVTELKAIPAYRTLFDKAFGGNNGEGITFDNVTNALAAFERTLLSFRSRYDRYVAGDGKALTLSEKRGLQLFFSTKTRCAECHSGPNFANPDFKVIGVPDPPSGPADQHHENAEPGRGGGPNTAYKIPSLRNVALHPPYMHNGTLPTLEAVVDFYSKGGGRGRGLIVPLQDDKIRRYDLTETEKADLVAFLHALTDTSALSDFPTSVPSGLPVVPRIATASSLSAYRGRPLPRLQRLTPNAQHPQVVEVRPGQSLQEAIDRAGRGGTVRVYPGVYRESLLVIAHDVTLEGVVLQGKMPELDGQNRLSDAVIALGNRFTIANLVVRDYQANGVVVRGAKEATFRNLRVQNTGAYGVYPVECAGVLVEKCVVTGVRDAGIYVGQSQRIVVRENEVFGCVAGIEIENSVEATVENNLVRDNTGGILVFVLPFNPSKVATDCRVVRNRVLNNNLPNFAEPGAFVGNVLQGTGIMILGADRTVVTENEIVGNGSFGVAVAGLNLVFPPKTRYDVEPFPDENRIFGNTLRDNGKAPDNRLARYGVPGRELIWDLSGQRNGWEQPDATTFPNRLPKLPK